MELKAELNYNKITVLFVFKAPTKQTYCARNTYAGKKSNLELKADLIILFLARRVYFNTVSHSVYL